MSLNKGAEKIAMRESSRAAIGLGGPRHVPNGGRMAFALKPGYSWNPLLGIPRNHLCPCDSGKKFKHCHLPTLPRAIPEQLAGEYRVALRDVGVVKFVEDMKDIINENQEPDSGRVEDNPSEVRPV